MVAISALRSCFIIAGQILRSGVVDLGDVRRVDGVFERGEVEPRQAERERGDGLQVIGLLGLAHVDHAERGLGQRGLQRHDVLRVARGASAGLPARVSIFADMGDVLLAELDVFVAGAEVVVLLRHAEAALADDGDLFGGSP